MADLIQSQLTDPFRIGLLVALFYVMLRTRAASGVWLPLAAGAIFVAVIIPLNGLGGAGQLDFATIVLTGLVSNALVLGLLLAGWSLIRKARQ